MSRLGPKVAVVTGAEAPLGRGLAAAFADAGYAIGLVGHAATLAPVIADLEAQGGPAVAINVALTDRDAVRAAFGTIADELGDTVRVVVHAPTLATASDAMPFEQLDDARWDAAWEGTMRAALAILQAAYAQMRERGGRIVVVTPTIAMSGAAQLTPYAAAAEGQRLLAKSAARQWGPDGITVNCLAAAPEHVHAGLRSTDVSLAPAALGGPGDPARDLGPVAVFLASDDAHFVTGATVCADGGVWMAP